MVTTQSFYGVLGVAPDADPATIRRAYLAAARAHHPDRHIGDPAAAARAEARMREINQAWSVLGDPRSRAAHDRELARRPSAAPLPPTVRPRPGPAGAAQPSTPVASGPGRLAMVPPLLLFAAVLCVGSGAILRLVPVVALGLGLVVLGVVSFVAVPVVTMHRSRR